MAPERNQLLLVSMFTTLSLANPRLCHPPFHGEGPLSKGDLPN